MTLATELPVFTGPGTEDPAKYANCMVEIRERMNTVERLVGQVRIAEREDVHSTELIFVQFRKSLELIAFGSLVANRARYSQIHKTFAQDWKAKGLLKALQDVNPDFYPVPLSDPERVGPKQVTFKAQSAPFLTKDDFLTLFDASNNILHSRNPFSDADPVRQIGYSVDEWVARIQMLLRWHYIQQTEGPRWLVEIPTTGSVHVYPGERLK